MCVYGRRAETRRLCVFTVLMFSLNDDNSYGDLPISTIFKNIHEGTFLSMTWMFDTNKMLTDTKVK